MTCDDPRLAELQARIAARHARSMTAWQAAQPVVTNHTCRHCGDYADATAANREEARIEWTCKRCRSATPEPAPDARMTIPQAAQRYGYALSTLRNATCAGDLAVIRDGQYVYTTARAVRNWEDSRDQRQKQIALKRWRASP